eukprot:TRINITY_DN5141_c0_g1_i2.p1 TRINITY_DN5141_c0_g1~~TRINITY_DN5141_c0_g1_i2.p1  ORF type:complete len:262 (-),score=42.49 TRINITY_DN5141_c0_g1_i2:42-827(-)
MIQTIIILLLLAVSYIAYRYYILKKTNVKSMPVQSFFFGGGKLPELTYNFMLRNKIDGFYHLFFGTRSTFIATDPDAAQFVLSTAKESFPKYSFSTVPSMKYMFDENLVTVNGDQWKRQRLVFNPAFNHSAYEQYYPKFREVTDKAMKIMSERSSGGKTDLDFVPLSQRFTLDILGRSIFNYDFQTLDGKIDNYYEAYKEVLNFDVFRLFMIMFPWIDHLPFIPRVSSLHKSITSLQDLFKKVVKEHKETGKLFVDGDGGW